MDKPQTVIFLMRHGATNKAFNSNSVIDNERILTEEGRAQEKKVGEYLKSFAPSVIYSSPMKRAVETAEIIKAEAEIPGEIILEDVLREMYHGKGEYEERKVAVSEFFGQLTTKHAGEHIVLSSHEDPLEAYVAHMGFTPNELDFPCLMSQGYRLVFAGSKPVECLKINPAKV